ncbi:MAG: GntR family transcriptional regulator [Chloroflexi bacterium]|uniref:GntR family transcriptional regulator n=1 Tax=Candidatus Chlorohelix allophototropha TaxID=3003348 RepID=A0A8T7M7L5_9CHLR|nr:GntR family transcriptional regulator [Chloroflexota bacterium]WJW68015.1 GntR family transcriptional regulator [Chloroflexota bacterium L227-S17]
MGLNISKTGTMPRYYQLREIIRERIVSGQWKEDDEIPSERELSEQYGLSRMTVRQSLSELVKEGLLYRKQGRGTFVSRPKITQQLIRLTGFTQDMQTRSQRPGATVLSAEMYIADQTVADKLRINLGRQVFKLRRLRLADGEPLAVELAYISFIGCEKLLEEDFERDSLYQVLETKYGLTPLEAEQELEAGIARESECRLLNIAPGSPVLLIRRITYTERAQPLEYAESVYRGDKYKFYARLVRE